ncbi:Peptidase C19 ubiquitin carboxyl-terminal hydrolase 2 [Penicillium taxi]|uniref:Peptidase C19 ubiquitin carboxyl-terminal hydrolase 2 n=1 Tax=Penicillium taxi TaxID=168475 RepID=UPI0025453816|nr:Peptidase C19 ubiquitin carboxyl-terminal hydrolase 2 [Penicillium taxi]KAJ5888002.1 Peptidase C19 ubiquitin carboxyl-terminal hydrolase 2 [Penicillium taxi]
MQEKPTTVAAYAAGASLAAIALFYVFGPNYTIDGDDSNDSNRKKSIVGLSNLANDCFINSVLQALAGLGDLRVYLIRELHRRALDGPEIYGAISRPDELPQEERSDKLRELQQGVITRALKEMLDRLNERPIYKKTISARGFIQALELAFRTRISRNQQDAQEFLQIVLERLCDEHHAGVRARNRALGTIGMPIGSETAAVPESSTLESSAEVEVRIDDGSPHGLPALIETKLKEIDGESGFPFEGKMESQIECQFCHYHYKPNQTAFVNLTLQVPQKSSTTLNACFDGLLKTEYIEDFRCDHCRLQHAVEYKTAERARLRSPVEQERLDREIVLIREALEKDPEVELEGIELPPSDLAPKRRIARHMRITKCPKVIAIHLSRSIYDHSSSTKNVAKVSFPERLPLGGILTQKMYKLLAIVCHKGSHQSGHYESFRRNYLYAPFSTPETFSSFAQSRVASENPSAAQSPRLAPKSSPDSGKSISSATSSTSLSGASPSQHSQLSPSLPRPTSPVSRRSFQSNISRTTSKHTSSEDTNSSSTKQGRFSFSSATRSSRTVHRSSTETTATGISSRMRRRRKSDDRWWRISDEKIKECKTSDVLGMQKDVYLLFYEMEKPSSRRGTEG